MGESIIEVSPQAEEFQLCFPNDWKKATGHRVKVNDFQFSAVPVTDKIIVSEISSGARFFETPIPKEVKDFESTMTFLEISIGARILMIIKKLGEEVMQKEVRRLTEFAVKECGEQPPITKVDTEWLKEDISDTLH
ncbi:hypothetical protein SAMN05421676_11231 [Salinibacillus kushneri]|uniref:Uncharacterized protein n=1 Tax=Salinibacillus kushneri TaxID=237682 RepID=A0A1I0IE66_9BACI|nr:hypothetical protein [Salinibacillus kushneri]SET95086.1 hypothetical protein SAMN05421676_11231 [Salinibacillus kushneri]